MSPAYATFTTYCVNTMGGRLYSGIPSLDVAISMAIDFERYQDDVHENEPFDRVEVTVEETDEGCGPFVLVYGGHSRGVGIHAQRRCEACRRA